MPLDEEGRQEVRRFHTYLTFWIGFLFVAASAAAAYILLRPAGARPSFLLVLERLAQKFLR